MPKNTLDSVASGLLGSSRCGAKVSDHKISDSKHLEILTPEQTLQILSIALSQVKAGNISANLLNEIR